MATRSHSSMSEIDRLAALALLQTEEERRRSRDIGLYGCDGVSGVDPDQGVASKSVKYTSGSGIWSFLLGVER